MEKKADYFLVGVFVLAFFFALVGFTIWLASPRDEDDYARYTVYFTDPVAGLDENSAVRYLGVEVGKVENLRFAHDRVDMVKADIVVRKTTPVQSRTTATLSKQAVTGFVSLELSTDPADKKPPVEVTGEKYPVLVGKPSNFDVMMKNLYEFSDSGLDDITATAREMRRTTESAHKLVDQLREDPSQLIWRKKKPAQPKPARVQRNY